MALFSRRKNDSSDLTPDDAVADVAGASTDATADAPVIAEVPAEPQAAAEAVPQVGISMTSFGGLGSAPAPAPAKPVTLRPEKPEDVVLPLAPSDPPTNLETISGLRDNAVLRDALAALGEKPSGAELLGVARQLLQGHVYLRVRGDARAQIAAGESLQLGIVSDGDRQFMLAYSSGRSLRDAFQKDNDANTSAFAQPAHAVINNVLKGNLAGLILDNDSAPARAVIPTDVLTRAMSQVEEEMKLKTILCEPRADDTKDKVLAALPDARLWVAVGVASEKDGEKQYGIAEAHTRDGRRLLQVFTHPLEVVALQRPEKPMPFSFDKLKSAFLEHGNLAGIVIDPAGPSIRLTRDELTPVLTQA